LEEVEETEKAVAGVDGSIAESDTDGS